ncbi:hypothetical protein WPS_29580 [Vulcanimicrobium alpinum]|uniref:Major facilitator superfamily (MFS) profile domain-containing protein n=1 Tax=Vulcanimicrobium alpinum TaxID=3016050 RepID=A0AAN1XYE0_UNVUL|nr:MFS transporter [Vulcanimicrobium alpinum]BDE07682.1 hypothetical protein WPS_29580 [Vulcanimicrobium alpinum]
MAVRRTLNAGDHAALNALWLGIQFQDASILAIVIPAILLKLAPADHTPVLAAIATVVAAVWVFVPAVAGALSDYARRHGGDRRRETAIALAVDIAALLAMAYTHAVGALGLEVACAAVAIASASSIYQAMLPEAVPRSAWGVSAGVRGAMTLLGTVGGLAAAALLPPQQALFAMAAAIALVAPSLLAIPRETSGAERKERAVIRDPHDLNVTLVARGWIVLGMTLLNTYVLYFFHDILGVRNASLGTGMVAGAALVGAIVSSVAAGILSDRLDRRLVVALSGVPMVCAALGFAIAPEQRLIFLYAALFGLGYGGVFSAGWALALDAIPALGDVARDLGIWGTLSNLPGVLAPAIGALVIRQGATPRDGYRLLFALAAASFAIGSLVVLRVGRRPVSSAWSVALLLLVTLVRQPFLATRIRVRQWGRLPFRRGPTVLVANHQHEDESEIVVERAFAQGDWRSTLITASSRRMYEPGFFAGRLRVFARIMRRVNAGPFFYALGMYPLENELSTRPLRSILNALYDEHAEASLYAVFRDDVADTFPERVSYVDELLDSRHFAATAVRVKLAHLRDPFRKELLARTRAEIDEDVARIVDVVQRGATFFVTPEGYYSVDGRMRPFKGILERLTPIADVRLAAIAFDPFRGRRLSMLYRVVAPADPRDLPTSVAAARPITTSALLAAWIVGIGLPFTAGEARDAVLRMADAAGPAAFVDPELRRDHARCVDEALAYLERHGAVRGDGGRYERGAPLRDPRFPIVEDMLAYQAAFHAETSAALRALSER